MPYILRRVRVSHAQQVCCSAQCLPLHVLLQVTADDVVQFVQQLLATKPSLAAYGDGSDDMYKEYEQLEQRYEALRGLLNQMQEPAWKRR
jgi:hypothetical protein